MNGLITRRRESRSIARRCKAAALGASLLTVMFAAAAPAAASQIDITNCQPQQVRICALDPGPEDPLAEQSTWIVTSNHILSQGDTKHFHCDARCKFWISQHCNDGDCSRCLGNHGNFLDHRWGKGTYQLVSLDRTKDNFYKSADLVEVEAGAQCP